MAKTEEKQRRKSLMAVLITLVALAALCLVAMAAGWVESPLLDSWFGNGSGGSSNGGGGGGNGGSGDDRTCFLNLLCTKASSDDESIDAQATLDTDDDGGIGADATVEAP